MRTLDQITAAARLDEYASHVELQYAVAAYDVLLAALDLPSDPMRLAAYVSALQQSPRAYVGDANDPENPKAREWYRAMALCGQSSNTPPTPPPPRRPRS